MSVKLYEPLVSYIAQVIQHEYDHLEGVLIKDKELRIES